MDGGDFSPNPPHTFTEDIGQLPLGEYQVTVIVRWSVSNPEPFDTLYGSFAVGQLASVPTLDVYGALILFLSLAGGSFYALRRIG